MTPTSPMVTFLAAYDSQLTWCGRLRDEFAARGWRAEVLAPANRSSLSEQQIAQTGFGDVEFVDAQELVVRAAQAQVLVCGLSGPPTRELIFALARSAPVPGPVIVAGWVGVIIEKITAGYLDRCGADVVAVNARSDLEHFRHAARCLDLPTDNLLLAGLPLLQHGLPQRTGPIRRVLFADQPTVPAAQAERLYLYRALLDYARTHPDREVRLRPRHRIGEDTFHRMRHHPETLLAEEVWPANFAIDYTPIRDALPDVDLLLTVSSTAALEALDHGCRVGLIADLGVHERYGNHVFLESGLLRTFSRLGRDDIGVPDEQWLDGYFSPGRVPASVVADRVAQLLGSGERPGRAVWRSDYHLSSAAYHAERERLRPPPAGLWRRGVRGLRRRLSRLARKFTG